MERPLSPVPEPLSLEKMAYNAIKEAILTFRLKPEENLVESDLARQLGISKTPVRESLSRLEREGFVTKIPYTGYYVTPISTQSVSEIFEIRAALEGLAASLAALRLSDEDITLAQTLVARHEQATQNGDIAQAARLNRQFHDLIITRAGNQRLAQILANLDEHLQRYRTLSNFQSGRLDKSVAEHRAVLTALEQRQPSQAEQAVRAHILSVSNDLAHQDIQALIQLARQNLQPGLLVE